MVGHGAKFGRKKEEAIAALLTQRNIEEAARTAGIGTQTLLRWLKVPEFEIAYREARRAAFGQSIARLQQASSAAVSTLLKIMIDPNSPPSTRVRAADSILDHAAKAIEIEDIEVRVAQLEAAAQKTASTV
jgi:transposase-like protein